MSIPARILACRSTGCRTGSSRRGDRIVCSTHGAEFRIEDGFCLRGPCAGRSLEAVPAALRDGVILVPEAAGL